MAEKLEHSTTNWDGVLKEMEEYLASVQLPAEFYREGVLKLRAEIIRNYPDELRVECERLKKACIDEGLGWSDSKIAIAALLQLASRERHDIPLEFGPDIVLERAK